MNAQISVETINPKTAAEWLDNKWEQQRPIGANHVTRLAQEIRNGNFRLTSDAVVLLKGRLANGQHRLSAVVEADKTAQFIVMRSSDEELFKVIDCGMKRTVSDVIVGVPYAKVVATAARLVLAYDGKMLGASGDSTDKRNNPLTRTDILDYIEKHQVKLSEQSAFILSVYKSSRIVGSTISTAFYHIASRKNEEKAKQFITNIFNGETVDATKDFRDRMIRQLGTKSRLRQAYVFALLIKSWKSFCNGTRPGTLKMNDGELFPVI